jgi:hypothetical protein
VRPRRRQPHLHRHGGSTADDRDQRDVTDPLVFPGTPAEAVVIIDQFLETFYVCRQNHYFDQIYRWYKTLDPRDHTHDTMALAAIPRSTVPGNDRGDDAEVAIAGAHHRSWKSGHQFS